MQKVLLLSLVFAALFVFSTCSASKKSTGAPKSTYISSIQNLILDNCAPCHIPAKGGNKKAFDNFSNVQTNIDEILRRIQLTPGEKGFMPFKRSRLSDSTIAVFKSWKADGLLEQ